MTTRIFYAAVALLLLLKPGFAMAASEYDIKAAYLLKIIKFIDWPVSAFESNPNSFIVCIVGEDPFPEHLYQKEGRGMKSRALVFRRLPTNALLTECQILFIAVDNVYSKSDILYSIFDSPVLTVSDNPKFVDMGGMISLVTKAQHVGIHINLGAAKRVSIKIRAPLLEVSSRIIDSEESN